MGNIFSFASKAATSAVRSANTTASRITSNVSRSVSNTSRSVTRNSFSGSSGSSGSSNGGGGGTTSSRNIYRSVPVYRNVFDQAGYDKFVAEEFSKAVKDVEAQAGKESMQRDTEVDIQRKQAGARQQFVKSIERGASSGHIVKIQQTREKQAGSRADRKSVV